MSMKYLQNMVATIVLSHSKFSDRGRKVILPLINKTATCYYQNCYMWVYYLVHVCTLLKQTCLTSLTHDICALMALISDISYLKTILPAAVEEEFYSFLKGIDTSKVTLCAMLEGSIVFPKIPLLRLEGPLPGKRMNDVTFLWLQISQCKRKTAECRLQTMGKMQTASHQYRGGPRFESRWSLDFFKLLLSNCLNWKFTAMIILHFKKLLLDFVIQELY